MRVTYGSARKSNEKRKIITNTVKKIFLAILWAVTFYVFLFLIDKQALLV